VVVEAVTVLVVAVVEVGVDADVVVVVTTVVDTVEVEGVAGVTVEEEEGGATDGELILIAMIRLILYNLSRFGSAIDRP